MMEHFFIFRQRFFSWNERRQNGRHFESRRQKNQKRTVENSGVEAPGQCLFVHMRIFMQNAHLIFILGFQHFQIIIPATTVTVMIQQHSTRYSIWNSTSIFKKFRHIFILKTVRNHDTEPWYHREWGRNAEWGRIAECPFIATCNNHTTFLNDHTLVELGLDFVTWI